MSDHRGQLLVFGVSGHTWAMPLEHVRETMRPLPVEPVHAAPSFVRGLSVVRGVPTPVFDAAALFSSASVLPATRLILLNAGNRCVALAVESVFGIRTIPEGSFLALPPLLAKANAEIIAAIGTLDAKFLLVLDAARFIPDDVWPALTAAGVRS